MKLCLLGRKNIGTWIVNITIAIFKTSIGKLQIRFCKTTLLKISVENGSIPFTEEMTSRETIFFVHVILAFVLRVFPKRVNSVRQGDKIFIGQATRDKMKLHGLVGVRLFLT